MRLFIAFEIPEDINKILFTAQDKIVFDGKATKPKTFHLTLKFLGEVDKEKADKLIDELSKIKFSPLDVSLSEVGAFPNKNNPRVVWVGLEPHDHINNIQQQVDKACQDLGFDPDNRFHPHLTLARIKFIKDKKQIKDCLDNLQVPKASFTVDSFKLIRSTLTPQGAEYDVLESFSAQQ
jgi:2'-5' RNA ligase